MSSDGQWLDLGLAGLAPGLADRVRLFRHLVRTGLMLRGRLDRELAPSGLTTRQAAMLQFIESQSTPPTIGRVAEALQMTHQNVKQIASALARKAMLTIVVDEQDRRARRLRVTDAHRRFWAARNPDDFERLREWTAGLGDAEVRTMVRLLARLSASLDDADRAAADPPPRQAPGR